MTALTTADRVSAWLGRSLSADQLNHVVGLIEAASAFVERRVGRRYTSAIYTDEAYRLTGPTLALRQGPVVSVEAVRSVPGGAGPAVSHTVEHLATGKLNVSDWQSAGWVYVSYTVIPPDVPADLALATAMIAGHWMRFGINPDAYGVGSTNLGGELAVSYTAAAGLPKEAQEILRHYQRLAFA